MLNPPNFENNTLMLGDNINLIPMLANESVDLIYCDPPFNSNRNYIVTDDKDVKYFKDVWKGGQDTYLEFMKENFMTATKTCGLIKTDTN